MSCRPHPFLLSIPGSVCVTFVTCCLVSDRVFGSTVLHADLGVRISTAARRPCFLARDGGVSSRFISQDTLGFIQILYLTKQTNLLASPSSCCRAPPSSCMLWAFSLVCHSTQFLHQFSTPPSHRSTAAAALSASLHGCTASCVRTRTRHIFTASFYQLLVIHCEEQGRHGRFIRMNGRTTTVTVLTTAAAATLSLRVCLCLSSQPLSQDDDGYLPQCLLPQALHPRSRKNLTPQFFVQKQHDQEHEQFFAQKQHDQSGQREKIEPMSMTRWSFFFPSCVFSFFFSILPVK